MISRYEIISASVSSIYHDIQKIQRTEMAKYGLKGPHAQCLLAMSRYPEGITAARLCEICEKDKAAISRTLTELEQAGMVSRQTNNGSRYRASLTLTEQGQAGGNGEPPDQQRFQIPGQPDPDGTGTGRCPHRVPDGPAGRGAGGTGL